MYSYFTNRDRSTMAIQVKNLKLQSYAVICKQLQQLVVKYLRIYWEESGFRSGYSCDSELATVCQDLADIFDDQIQFEHC